MGAMELRTDFSNREAHSLRLNELEQLAFLDHLTRLANRNYIHRELKSCFEERVAMTWRLACCVWISTILNHSTIPMGTILETRS